jgi:hypothetical protein
LTELEAQKAVADATVSAARSGLAEVNEDFYTLTGILPNNISEDDYSQITCSIPPSNKEAYASADWTETNPDGKTVVAINADSLNEGNDWAKNARVSVV